MLFRAFGHAAFAVVVSLCAVPSATAMVLDADEALEAFNLIVFGNLSSANSGVEGRVYIGGNLSGGSANYFERGNEIPAIAGIDAVYIGGNVSGGFKQVNNNGNARIGGNVENMNMNGGMAYIGGSLTGTINGGSYVTGAAVTLPSIQGSLTTLSSDLSGIAANSTISVVGNLATFNAAPDSDGRAVFNIADGNSLFSTILEITFNLNGATDVVLNVGGTSVLFEENILGGSSALAAMTQWNFHEATTLNITRQFYGTILAPHAGLTNSQELLGTVVVANFTQNGQVRLPTYGGGMPSFSGGSTGVPEPEQALLLLGGLGLIGVARKLRRR